MYRGMKVSTVESYRWRRLGIKMAIFRTDRTLSCRRLVQRDSLSSSREKERREKKKKKEELIIYFRRINFPVRIIIFRSC